MSGHGTGYPIAFVCPKARQNRVLWSSPERGRLPGGHNIVVRTGRTRPMPRNGKGHPRKLWTSHEFRCECGHVGWTSHVDIVRYPAERGQHDGH